MPEVTQHEPGDPCWIELATSDRVAATKFYSELFGWEVEETPIPGDVYIILKNGGKDAAALYFDNQSGLPPRWTTYIAVASADDAATKAKSLGGTVVAGPFDAMDYGRMAIMTDPSGAAFAVWQANKNIGIRTMGEPVSLCWIELTTPAPAKCEPFYTQLFGWNVKHSTDGMPYTEWHQGERGIGGMMETPKEMPDMPPHWMPYFSVSGCDATLEKAKSLGTTDFFGPHDIPHVGRFAILQDPQGARFAIIELKR